MRTIEGYPYRQQRIRIGVYRIQVDDGGGWRHAGDVAVEGPGRWRWAVRQPGSNRRRWDQSDVRSTLHEAATECALAWIRGVEAAVGRRTQRAGQQSGRTA